MDVPKRAQIRLAALPLAVAAVVLIVTPVMLNAANPLAPVAAVIVAVGCGGAFLGGRRGRRIALAVSWAGLLLSVLWLWLASSGFGQGTPWQDDMIEAATLVAAFLAASVLLWWAGGDR